MWLGHHGERIKWAKTAVRIHLIHVCRDTIKVSVRTVRHLAVCIVVSDGKDEFSYVQHQLYSLASFFLQYGITATALDMVIHVSYASFQNEFINHWGKQWSISNSRSCLHGKAQLRVLSSCILLNKFKDYVDKCLAMIDMNCKEVERAISVCEHAYVCVCLCVCADACIKDINECIKKMNLNTRGRQTEEFVSLSNVHTSYGEKHRHSVFRLPYNPIHPPPETTINWLSRQW